MQTLLILEDDRDRIAAFTTAIQQLEVEIDLKFWRDADSMSRECEAYFPIAALICVNPALGCSLDIAKFLADFLPVCPILLYSSDAEQFHSVQNEFRSSGWLLERVCTLNDNWVTTSWLSKVRTLLALNANTWKASLPPDHEARVHRMLESLDGLSIGDSLGEIFAYHPQTITDRIRRNDLPPGPWHHTDDTEMAISVASVLKSHGLVDQNALSRRFMRRFQRDPDRGYGMMSRLQLQANLQGNPW
jgi:hypothetical protein